MNQPPEFCPDCGAPVMGVDSPFDGVVASGWHTAAMTMRILVDNYLGAANAHGALGLEKLRWPTPVHPGDTIFASITFSGKRQH